MKRMLPLLAAIALLAACQNSGKSTQEEAVTVTTASFESQAPELVDQLVKIDGTVMHVCKHGGKRLFLGEERIKVLATNEISTFDVALEGSDIAVEGFLREERIDEEFLKNWEMELQEGEKVEEKEVAHKGEPGHDHAEETGDAEDAKATAMKQIQDYRDQIASSGKGYLSFYSIDIKSLEEKK